MWNKDEVKGKAEQVKGIVREKAGQVTGDKISRQMGLSIRWTANYGKASERQSDT
jgi:uncharacterized protein YjbJ (UPF0337 family)